MRHNLKIRRVGFNLKMRTLVSFIKCTINYHKPFLLRKFYCTAVKPPWKIMFFGADDFSLNSLKSLHQELKHGTLIKKLEVVTTVKGRLNPICNFSKQENLVVHSWPTTPETNKYDLGIVVSFGHLIPDIVIDKFPLGILNVHASLLPRWRGAAPIIHSILNGDDKTGVTIMKIKPKKFDIGEMLLQQEIEISNDIKMPELYNKLSILGANILINCLQDLNYYLENAKMQPSLGVTQAPKVTPNLAKIDWSKMSSKQIYNLSRALYNLYPLVTTWKNWLIKLYDISLTVHNNKIEENIGAGAFKFSKMDNKLLIKCCDGHWISCNKIGLPTKKPMLAKDFNNGYLKKEIIENKLFK